MAENYSIPEEVAVVAKTLEKAGFKSYLIGGCVRDTLIGIRPKDWDITTDATPDQIISLFPKTFYENEYGTVGIVNEATSDETLKVIEVTPFRIEHEYSNNRHPDKVTFSKNIEEDLKRRDFTINAIALKITDKEGNLYKGQITDPHKGQNDISLGILRTVGEPEDRFSEDALRILRAVRISSELGFKIDEKTKIALKNKAFLLNEISKERIRDEFSRMIMSDRPMDGIILAHELGILKYIIPEIEEGINIKQNQAHIYDVWEHSLRSLQHGADKKYPFEVRLSALLHDIAKPRTRDWSKQKNEFTFYGHDVIGRKMAIEILNRLKFPKKTIDVVSKMVRWHMFFSDTELITLSSVRRLIRNVGRENIWNLMNLRICDRIGTGRPKEDPYRLRKFKSMIEEALRDPISVGMLKVNGKEIMDHNNLIPSPTIGYILHALLEEVLENPKLNTKDYLLNKSAELSKLDSKELQKIGEKGKEKKEEEESQNLDAIRKKYWVK